MGTKNDCHQLLKYIAKQKGFKVKGNCCYRIMGEGILQLLKFDYEPRFLSNNTHTLSVGLYSLYMKMSPCWMTPSGCIVRYAVNEIAGFNAAEEPSIEAQILALKETVLPMLDMSCTQRDLISAMCNFDLRSYGKIRWNDSFKLEPFLHVGDYISAERVIAAILQQHVGPDSWTNEPWSQKDFEIYRHRYPDKDTEFLMIHDWISDSRSEHINGYLKANYEMNREKLKKLKLL